MKLQQDIQRWRELLAEIHEEEGARDAADGERRSIIQKGSIRKELPRLSNLAAFISSAPEKLKVLNQQLTDVGEAIRTELRTEVRQYNAFVAERVKATFDLFISVVNPFYGGPEKERLTRREFEYVHIPLLSDARRAAFELGDWHRLSIEKVVDLAGRFIVFRAEKCQTFSWDLSAVETFQDSKPATPSRPPQKIRVQVLENVTLPCLGIKDTSKRPKMHGTSWAGEQPDRQLKRGEIIEISSDQYPALARFFEIVSES